MLETGADYDFRAGQYLHVVPDGVTWVPLSIASSPSRLPQLELHYRSTPGDPMAEAIDQALTGEALDISAAQGQVICPIGPEPMLIVAGGTGAAQAFACAEFRSDHHAGSTTVLWCADRQADVYATEQLGSMANTELIVCIDDRRTPDNEGLTWLKAHASRWRSAPVTILAGGPPFVYAATDLLLAAGFTVEQLRADAFDYAPRPAGEHQDT